MVKAFGLDNITGPLPSISYGDLKLEFSLTMQEEWTRLTQRPRRPVELLVGSERIALHPVHVEGSGNMVIKKSLFRTGLVLNGTHKEIETEKVVLSETAAAIRLGNFEFGINHMAIQGKEMYFEPTDQKVNLMKEKDFWEAEQLGCEAPRRCKNCRGCQDCSFRGQQMS